MIKIPKNAVENFITSEMKYKRCKENEFQICSLYVQDAKYKCYINTEMFVFCDFKAGVSGSCYSLFRDFLNLESNKEVLIYIMKNYAYNEFLTIENKINEIKTNENIINDFNEIDKPIYFFQKDKIGAYGRRCLKYLLDRKIDASYIKNMGYVYNKDSKFNKRIILPYFENNEMVYFQARAIDKSNQLRYLNPAGLSKQNYIFNYDKIDDSTLICVEGIFDAMSIDPNEQVATSMNGAFFSPKQLEKIFSKARPKTIIYVPDNDKTGEERLNDNIKKIYTYADYTPEVLIFDVPDNCKDLNDMLINTGKNVILKKDCVKFKNYRKRLFNNF